MILWWNRKCVHLIYHSIRIWMHFFSHWRLLSSPSPFVSRPFLMPFEEESRCALIINKRKTTPKTSFVRAFRLECSVFTCRCVAIQRLWNWMMTRRILTVFIVDCWPEQLGWWFDLFYASDLFFWPTFRHIRKNTVDFCVFIRVIWIQCSFQF